MKLYELFLGERAQRRFQMDALDGIRGLAVLFVLFSHVANKNILIFDGIKFAGKGSGVLGAFLFFVLSAFLLTRSFIRIGKDNLLSPLLWTDYFMRRTLRIYPLYTIVLLFVFMAVSISEKNILHGFSDFSFDDFLNHLLLQDGMAHLWTVAAEVKYYFILPILIFICAFLLNGHIIMIIAAMGTTSIIFSIYVFFFPPEFLFSIKSYLPIFLGGSLFAFIHEWYQQSAFKISSIFLSVTGSVLFSVTILLMPNVFIKITGLSYDITNPFVVIGWGILFGLFILVVVNEQGVLNRIFSSRLIRFIGMISFSIYLWHWFILQWISSMDFLPNLGKMFLFYALTGMISAISFIFIERPLSRIRVWRLSRPSKSLQLTGFPLRFEKPAKT